MEIAPPRSLRIRANGLEHHVLEWDGGGRTTVVCLHGFLDLAWSFFEVAPRLARAGYHVVAPDLRGHGDTERVGTGGYYHFFDYLWDVADLVAALKRDRVLFVGHSMGGAITSYFAASFPELVDQAAILEGLGLPEETWEQLPDRVAEWVTTARRARTRSPRIYKDVNEAAARLRSLDPLCDEATALFLADKGTRVVDGGRTFKHDPLHLVRGPLPFRLEVARAFWSRVRCPVLIVDASESEFKKRGVDMEARHACFAHARRHTVDGAGHMMMRHRPDEIARALLAFFAAA